MITKTLDNLNLKGKKVLLRCDLNVPFDLDGKVLDSTKIERHKITIDELIHKGAKVIIISHLGRPKGSYKENLSLKKVLNVFADIIKVSQKISYQQTIVDYLDKLIRQIANRTFTIKNAIEWRKFTSGAI